MAYLPNIFNSVLFRQLFCFGVIGTLAAMVHLSIVILLVEAGLLQPLVANIIAFICAFNISFFGHRHLTFRKSKNSFRTALPRFLLVASTSFVLNEGLFYFFLKVLPYTVALVLVLILVSLITFILSKIWAFR